MPCAGKDHRDSEVQALFSDLITITKSFIFLTDAKLSVDSELFAMCCVMIYCLLQEIHWLFP